MKIAISNICSAFETKTIGSKVLHKDDFLHDLSIEIVNARFGKDGQAMIFMEPGLVSCGVASRHGLRPEDYVIREHRGEVLLFAGRRHAAETKTLSVLVYRRDAYIAQAPTDAIGDAAYVIVAVLAEAGPKAVLSSHRFVRNLAGGNPRYLEYTIEQARQEARAIFAYEREWAVVSD